MMTDEFIQIRFHKLLLVLTKSEYLKGLKRGRTVERNSNAAKKRGQAGEYEQGLGKAVA